MPARPRGSRLHRREPSRMGERPQRVYLGRVLQRGRIVPAEVAVGEDGRILRVARSVTGGQRVDWGEMVILPSATDVHVHFRDPGPADAPESFVTGSLQAAFGGVGAVVDMPNTEPPTTTSERLEAKAARVRGRACIDVALFAALAPGARVAELAPRASGFKLYLAPTTGHLEAPSPLEMSRLLPEVAKSGRPLHVHAEDPALFPRTKLPPRDPEAWDGARPVAAETAALGSVLAGPPGLRWHVAHATTAESVRLAHARGATVEATAHHLLLSTSARQDARWKVNPPLRAEEVRRDLFDAFARGDVDMLASDHAPHDREAKDRPFSVAPSGMPGVEVLLPLLLSEAWHQRVGIEGVVRAAATRPAEHLGLPRGELRPGLEANFLAVDFRARRRIRERDLHAPSARTPWEGKEAIFPQEHVLRGATLVTRGEFVGGTSGRFLEPAPVRGDREPRPPA